MIRSPLGPLRGAMDPEYYPGGALRQCRLLEPNTVRTPSGAFTARHSAGHVRVKYGKSLSFHKSGAIRSLCLERQGVVETPLGPVPAEFVTWHESGAVRRVFPRNGMLSAYWTQEDEANLAWSASLDLSVGRIEAKIVGLHFYESGALRSVTLWPGEQVVLHTPAGDIPCRVGFSLYENGSLESCEPVEPGPVRTPFGHLPAFDPEPLGVHADENSLRFSPEGQVESLVTCAVLTIGDKTRGLVTIGPSVRADPFDETVPRVIPLLCCFKGQFMRVVREGKTFVFRPGRDTIRVAPYVHLPFFSEVGAFPAAGDLRVRRAHPPAGEASLAGGAAPGFPVPVVRL